MDIQQKLPFIFLLLVEIVIVFLGLYLQEDLLFIFSVSIGVIFAFLVLYIMREDFIKERYVISCHVGERKASQMIAQPLLLANFDNIPNAAKLVEKYSFDKDPRIREGILEIINVHFDKIPNAGKIVERLSHDSNSDVKLQVVYTLINHFNKIPSAGKIVEQVYNASKHNLNVEYAISLLLEKDFDKIPDAKKIFAELLQSVNRDTRWLLVKILKNHFDKIPGAGKIFAELYKYGETDENMNLLLIEILRDRFNKIPKAPEIFVNILGTVMTTSTSGDDEIVFQSVIRIFSEHFYEIPDAKKLLEIFIPKVNKTGYIKELCKQQYFKNFFVNIPNGMEILKKNGII